MSYMHAAALMITRRTARPRAPSLHRHRQRENRQSPQRKQTVTTRPRTALCTVQSTYINSSPSNSFAFESVCAHGAIYCSSMCDAHTSQLGVSYTPAGCTLTRISQFEDYPWPCIPHSSSRLPQLLSERCEPATVCAGSGAAELLSHQWGGVALKLLRPALAAVTWGSAPVAHQSRTAASTQGA